MKVLQIQLPAEMRSASERKTKILRLNLRDVGKMT